MDKFLTTEKKQQFHDLVQLFKKQDFPTKNLYISERVSPDYYLYAANGNTPEVLDKKSLSEQAPLFAQIFAHKSDRNVIVTCQPKYVSQIITDKCDVLPVLDDLPQIVGLKAKLCDGNNQKAILKALSRQDACLLYNHKNYGNAVLAIGTSLKLISATVSIVEKSSQAMIEAECLGGAKKLSYLISSNYRKLYLSSYSKMNQAIKSLSAKDFKRQIPHDELTLRQMLVNYGNKLVDENLTQGTWGNLSLRLDQQYMLITPSGMAYDRLTPYDMVRVNYHTLESEGTLRPSVESGFHAVIYREHEKINGVIHTHSFNCSVFAAANQALPIILPEAISLLGSHSGYCPYEKPGSDELVKAIASSITETIWSCIMGNHGMVVCGSSLSDTFERTLLMEQAARYYLDIHCQP